ncbi:MAG: polysaccharide biosynthesis protein, partial [Bacteroidetes bacterium]|nr:polysaccharide biosynthesis protein [Bacteroidota bacterium]
MAGIFFLRETTPRWIIFLIDLIICLFSIVFAYLLRFNFYIPEKEMNSFVYVIPLVVAVRSISFIVSRIYAGIVRYTTTRDAERIFLVVLSGSVIFAVFNIVSLFFILERFIIPFSIVIIDFLVTVIFMVFMRMLVKTIYLEYSNPRQGKSNIIIFGTGEFGIITKRTLDRDAGTNYKVIAFVDNTTRTTGQMLEGVYIYHTDQLDSLLTKKDITNLIFAKDNISPRERNEITEICLANNVRVLTVPPVSNWINGELSFNQIKKIRIEDLLERASIKLDLREIRKRVQDRCVLVTGAAGSIGSELTRQLLRFNPGKIVLLDQAESALHDMEIELYEIHKARQTEVVIGDITDKVRMRKMFEVFRPELIYHAAAYKHVPMMENNPVEAVRTNILGTKIIADLAAEFGAEMFVMISTDKAVNPTNIMGASKRIAELYIQSLNNTCKTRFVTTRFGNVLGSTGSVIPR